MKRNKLNKRQRRKKKKSDFSQTANMLVVCKNHHQMKTLPVVKMTWWKCLQCICRKIRGCTNNLRTDNQTKCLLSLLFCISCVFISASIRENDTSPFKQPVPGYACCRWRCCRHGHDLRIHHVPARVESRCHRDPGFQPGHQHDLG